ncbi:hypothetical protein BGX28_006367 [Mortierella sp. GBA30]|nr:hypothetical protein BGX28_006367 [Mortierella sp. GBA30]
METKDQNGASGRARAPFETPRVIPPEVISDPSAFVVEANALSISKCTSANQPYQLHLQHTQDKAERAGSSRNKLDNDHRPNSEKNGVDDSYDLLCASETQRSPSSQQQVPLNNSNGWCDLRQAKTLVALMTFLFAVAVLNLLSSRPSTPCATISSLAKEIYAVNKQVIIDSKSCEPHQPLPRFLFSLLSSSSKPKRSPRLPPRAKRIPHPLSLYNQTLIDYYHWMHSIDRDPDVQKYINQESEYTSAWTRQSGVKALQKQIEYEMQQIHEAINRQPYPAVPLSGQPEQQSEGATKSALNGGKNDGAKQRRTSERLEDTLFWDLDRWRYWLDKSVGDYGVFKRRPVPKDMYQLAEEERKRMYLSTTSVTPATADTPLQHRQQVQQSAFTAFSPAVDTDFIGGCSRGRIPTPVQLVFDINRLARKQGRKGEAGQFSFGSIEIQPKFTFLRPDTYGIDSDERDKDSDTDGVREPASEDLYMAYTYDTLGDERYKIGIKTLAIASSSSKDQLSRDLNRNSPNMRDRLSMNDELWDNLEQDADITIDGAPLKGAGPDTRWAKLGQSLYLYFTRLDSKGLARQVWRIKVDTLEGDKTGKNSARKGASRIQFEPEMVMQEMDARNTLGISMTADNRFLLIESSGQTSSYTYFLSIDSPDKGWNLVRRAEEDVIYKVEHHSGYFYLRSNHGGAINFKVIRIPVEYYLQDVHASMSVPAGQLPRTTLYSERIREDEVVIAHEPDEFLERLEVFVEHIVAWVWHGGLQEIRIFLAPRPGDTNTKFPLPELQRIRPYDKDLKLATLMPGNTRDEGQRVMRDFYSTRLLYSNCSFIRPWTLYELDMHALTPVTFGASDDGDERLRNATRQVCRDPFPVGVQYGRPKQYPSTMTSSYQSLTSSDSATYLKDPEEEQEKEMAKFKEMRIMVPSTRVSKRSPSSAGDIVSNSDDEAKILIPVSLAYYSLPDDQQLPFKTALVTAYGAYGAMTAPKFNPLVMLPLLHRGFLYVQVHPRGDGVMGARWYADGKLESKMNTFYDVEDVLRHLRDSGMVEKDAVVIEGRSAGGLVSGWMANRWGEIETPAPGTPKKESDEMKNNIVREMVRVVLAQVPFVDVIADMVDPEIPWVEYEWAEWGSPLKSRDVFEVMKRYAPYDRIRNQPYPAMMIMGGLADTRVSYAEPLKFVTKMRGADGKTNDCEPLQRKGNTDKKEADDEEGSKLWNDQDKEKKRMCAGKHDTPLLLQMEDGGHFSGNDSLWMAFAVHQMGAEKVVTA